MKDLKSISKENIDKNFWSVISVVPEIPQDYSDSHFFDVYCSTLKFTDYFNGSSLKFHIYCNSRQEMYIIFSELLDHEFDHIKINDPCDESGKDTFRRINKRIWFPFDDLKAEEIEFWDSSGFCIETLPRLEVNIPYTDVKEFFDFINSLKSLNFMCFKLKDGYQIGSHQHFYIID